LITKDGEYRIKVAINRVDLLQNELIDLFCHFELGNKMAWCDITIRTKRKEVYRQALFEMSIIDVMIQSVDKNNAPVDKQKMRYFLADNAIKLNTQGNEQIYEIKVIGVVDAWKYLGYPDTKSANSRLSSPKFLSKLKYWEGNGSRGSGSFKLEIKDGLQGKATDWMYWLQPNINGQELVNQVLLRPLLKTNSNKGGDREYIYTSSVEFDDEGNPKLVFYDVKLRTQAFSPPSCKLPAPKGYGVQSVPMIFSFKDGDQGKVRYSEVSLDIKGATYSSMYWQRSGMVFDTEEGEYTIKRIKQPKLFPDSMAYSSQIDHDGSSGTPPPQYTLFTNYSRWKMEWHSTNHYNMNYSLQKFQITATLLALRKINITATFRGKFIKAKPIQICKFEIQEGVGGDTLKIDPTLSGRYMITKVVYGLVDRQLFTTITGSRDSFVGS